MYRGSPYSHAAQTTTIGGTIITDTLALLVLAVISASSRGEITTVFWVRLVVMIFLYTAAVFIFIPIILLDPIDQEPADHLKALADIANLIKIKGIVGKLKKARNYDELVKEINKT